MAVLERDHARLLGLDEGAHVGVALAHLLDLFLQPRSLLLRL